MPKKILITGANGFIGSSVFCYLKKKNGFQVSGVDITEGKDKRILKCDISNPKTFEAILRRVKADYIFHCAGGRLSDEKAMKKINIGTTQNLFKSLKKISDYHPRIIVPGSAAEYGQCRGIVTEKYRCRPLNPYGRVKFEQSRLALNFFRQGQDIMIARIFNITGKLTPPTLAAGYFAQEIARLEKSKQRELKTRSLEGKRDFLDIEDVARALFIIALKGKKGQIYNVCSSQANSMRDVLKTLIRLSRVRDISILEDSVDHSKTFDVIGSNKRLKSLGWRKKVNFRQSLKKTLESYRA